MLKAIVVNPRPACAKIREILQRVSPVMVTKASREGNITSRKDPMFIETARATRNANENPHLCAKYRVPSWELHAKAQSSLVEK